MSLLYHRVSFDYEFMKSSLSNVIKNDQFTKRLFDIYSLIQTADVTVQPVVLTIQRADYMFHKSKNNDLSLKQVEVNNIASGFGSTNSKITELHVEMLRQLGHVDIKNRLPENRAFFTVARGIVDAWKWYNKMNSFILFVVEEENQNVIDQRLIEYEILKQTDSQASVIFLTLRQCFQQLYVNPEGKLLKKHSNEEFAVVYYRAGYVPQHYPTENEWGARLMLEKALAIKCPWIGAHLAGTKKIQQVLSDQEVLARFVENPETRQRIAETFVGLYSLEKTNKEIDKVIQNACNDPEKYVLKPQLEGGGNNFYGNQVREKLLSLTPDEREAYILMDRICPVEHENILVRANQPAVLRKVVSEFGTFGYLLGDVNNVISNESGGHLFRTKIVGVDEGGVIAGASVLDSPYLF